MTANKLELPQTLLVRECVLLSIEFLVLASVFYSLFRSDIYIETSHLARSVAEIGS